MRYVCLAITMAAASVVLPASVYGQTPLGVSVTNYQLVGEQKATRTQSYFTYRADLVSLGSAREAMTATVSSLSPTATVVAGQGSLSFPPVAANGQVASTNTFTILIDRTYLFSFSDLKWSFAGPIANAGPSQTARLGSTVTLNGSASTNLNGGGPLTYSWAITYRPGGSKAQLSDATAMAPSFVADVTGRYIAALTVSNQNGSDTSTISVNTVNSPPVANGGPNESVPIGSIVRLNGGASSDVDGDPLSYAWTLSSRPAGSAAILSGADTVSPTFVADKTGLYVLQLLVSDPQSVSAPALVTITTMNTPPVAKAGTNQLAAVGDFVRLNGSESSDVDGDSLHYQWTLISAPVGSKAALDDTTAVNPAFKLDRSGTYVAQLVVNDGKVNSEPSTVAVTTNAVQYPIANAGLNQTVAHGAIVTLSGRAVDPQSLPVDLEWSLVAKPQGSNAALSGAAKSSATLKSAAKMSASAGTAGAPGTNATFVADKPGTYVGQLIASNGILKSVPSTVTITTTNSSPVANAGPNQTGPVGAIVVLDGSASSDADHDPLQYSWSFTSRPAASAATLSAATTSSPTFLTDVAGLYVAQLIVSDGFTSSVPATVSITAGASTITLTPDPLNLFNTPGSLTVNLPSPAAAGGLVLKLASLDTQVATVSDSITIPADTKSATIQVTPKALGSTLITASAAGLRPGTATVNVGNPSIGLSLAASTVGLSRTIGGTVTLNGPAPAGGLAVSLFATPTGIVSIQPGIVTVAEGATTGAFSVTGASVGSATINGSAAGFLSGSAQVSVARLGFILLQSGVTVGPSQSAPIEVSLATPAPVGGAVITLSSSNTNRATVAPTTVTIPQGATTPPSQPQVTGVAFGSAIISASAPGFTGASETVQVAANLSFSPINLTVSTGSSRAITLNLSAQAPAGGLVVTLNSNKPNIATMPASVTIPANASSASVAVTGAATGSAVITASAAGITSGSANITVVAFGTIDIPSTLNLGLGQSASFPVTISTAAPDGGLTLNLASSDASKVTISPTSITIPAGQKQPATQPQVKGVNLGSATISASATGFGGATSLVQVNASAALSPATLTISGGTTQNLTLTLSAPAPAGGVTVNISADNSAIATAPASVVIAASNSATVVPITGKSSGSTVIRASGANITAATATVTVQGGTIGLPSNLSLAPGQSLTFAITLSSPAPAGGVVVTLATSDGSRIAVSPASVTIPAGQTQPATQPKVTGVNFGSATITASAPSFGSSSRTIQVGATLSLAPQLLVIAPGAVQSYALNLSAPAPAGGLVVTLKSSNTLAATVPASVTIAQNAMTAAVPVTGIGVGSAVITASSIAPNVQAATASVTVQLGGLISMPVGAKVNAGQTIPFPITLSSPAPAAGVMISLTSNDTAKLTISPSSVSVAGGQTAPAQQPQISGKSAGSASIGASAPGYTSASQVVQVLAALSFSPQSLTFNGPGTQNLTLSISTPAPTGGLTASISSTNTAVATVPSIVTIAQNTTSITVPVTGVATGATVVRATAANLADATASVTVQSSADILLPADLVVAPGEQAVFPVKLAKPAAQAVFVDLASSDTSKATLNQQTIFINPGQTEPAAQPRINGISSGSVTVTASSFGLRTASTKVQVGFDLTFTPSSINITGTATQNLTLTLNTPAPVGGLTVALTSTNTGVATVPASVFFGANATTVNVPVKGVGAGSSVIQGDIPNLAHVTAQVTVINPGAILLPANLNIGLGQAVPFAVTLSTPAPASGVVVTLVSSDSGKVKISPATVSIASGQTKPTVQPTVTGENVGSANITASAPGYTPATQAVKVSATVTFAPKTLTLSPNSSGNLTLALSASAPWEAGVTVILSSSNPSVATVQASVNFFPDGSAFTTVVIPVKALAAGTTVIHASGVNIPDETATVTVTGPLSITTTTLPNGSVNASYSATLTAAGGTPPLKWALIGGTLPSGLTLDPATGRISGKPGVLVANTPLTFRVTDSASPALSASANLTLTIVGPASITATTGTLQSAPTGALFGLPLSAIVKDSAGNPLSNASVTFTAPASGASGTFNGALTATVVTNASGLATSPAFRANSTKGGYAVTATVAGVATHATFNLTNTAETPATITVTGGTPQSTPINSAFASPLSVLVKDAAGTPVKDVTVVFTPPTSGPGGTFQGGVNTAITNATGVATSAVFTANSLAGVYSVSARVSGVTSAATFALTNKPGPAASITATGGSSQSAGLNSAFAAPLSATVKDVGGNAVPGVTVTFTAPSSGASGTFLGGVKTAVTNASGVATSPKFTANGTQGAYTVQASVPNVAASASFSLSNTAALPTSIAAVSGTPQSADTGTLFASPLAAIVKDSAGKPLSGITVTFVAPSSGPSIAFAGGVLTAVTNASGVATSAAIRANDTAGSYTVRASVAGLGVPAAFQLTNVSVPVLPRISIGNATVGQGLQTPISVAIPAAAPPGGVRIAIASADQSRVLVAGRPGDAGVSQILITIGEGLTSVGGIYIHGLAKAGTVSLKAAAQGYADGSATVTLSPSGFAIAGPNGLGSRSFDAPKRANTQVTVFAVRLSSSLGFVEAQQVRGGTTVTVPLSNAVKAVGTLSASSVTLLGGAGSAETSFQGLTTGSTSLTAGVPAGFSAPADGVNSVTAIVPPDQFFTVPATVGQNLETNATIRFSAAAPANGLPVTITSNDPSKLLLSTSATVTGSTSITINVQGGRTNTPDFFVHGLASTGSASYSASAPGFTSTTGTVNLRPSGFVISGPFGLGADFFTTPGAANADITIMSALLDASRNYVGQQPVRGGLTVNVTVDSSIKDVGKITTLTVVFTGGLDSRPTQFDPLATGETVLSVAVPSGFSSPAKNGSLVASVRVPSLGLTGGVNIGKTLQATGILLLGQPAPAGGLPVTLTVTSGQLVISASSKTAGSPSVIVTVPAGQSSANYYLQALGDTGTANYSASAPNYQTRTASVTLTPSGVVIAGPFGLGFDLVTTVAAGPQPVSVSLAQLDPGTLAVMQTQPLAGGSTLAVSLTNSMPTFGTVNLSVTIGGGTDTGSATFTPKAVGQTTIGVVRPSAYAIPAKNTALVARVQ